MRFDILTLFPEVVSSFLESSITGNAARKGILEFNYINIRSYADDKHNRVDDYTFGGGPGMLIRPQPVFKAYNHILSGCRERPYTVYLSPRGRVFNQGIATELAQKKHLVVLCGHYEGIDQRAIDEICDCELSIGDYVLTGGEIAAAVVCDAVSRLIPGVLSDSEGYENESHFRGLLEFPQYTRPREFNGKCVPEVLLSGNDKEIDRWRYEKSVEITEMKRPDMYEHFTGKKAEEQKKYSIRLVCNDKTSKKYMSYLSKLRALGIEEDEASQCFAAVSCGSEKIEINGGCGFFVILKDESEYEPQFEVPEYIQNEKYRPGRLWCSPLEAAEETLTFLSTYEKYREILQYGFGNDGVRRAYGGNAIKLIKPVSYDIYENNITKFRQYKPNEVFLTDLQGEYSPGEYTMICGDGDIILEGELYTAKFRGAGRKYLFAAGELDKKFEKALLEGKCEKISLVYGKICEELYNIYRMRG